MAYHDVLFPTDISYGSRGGPGFNTQVLRLDSAAHEAIERWSNPKYKWDVSYGLHKPNQIAALLRFFNARRGSSNTFKFKDPLDYASCEVGQTTETSQEGQAVSATDQVLGTGDASNKIFQAVKKYEDGGGAYSTTRTITKLVDGTVVVALDGTPTAAFSVDLTTGEITMNSAPGSGVIVTAGFEFYCHVMFSEETDRWLSAQMRSFDGNAISEPIILEEVAETRAVAENFNYRGSSYLTLVAATTALTVSGASFYVCLTSPGFDTVKLPSPADLDGGGPYFLILNVGATVLRIVDQNGTLLLTRATTLSAQVWLGEDAAGAKAWVAF